ncbi:type II toxin-antitoxin system MqsR family toxin [Pediococcus argentinicus]|uniref:type II toxin-antitoxin system MqsR family toxin n=1 Tax=Pediococcus argentinicus TaxID=480391 RepID=UPI000710DC6F|nr:type II toxin-antitoxin system MqsR family toxin [Pediococcus argentinicus]NKZ21723.1 type II toxin-antitoxin system MqsR family toxin [Pediococcus argentinicus]GEP18886.1 hypothetical protein LSA03_02700 [Pediococcus argentinicus]
MSVNEALAKLKYLVSHGKFKIVNRRDSPALPVSNELAREIIRQLALDDFIKCEPNRNNPIQMVWIFKTDDGQRYYIKFLFLEEEPKVIFISFHLDC